MTPTCILGIDPGLSGALALLDTVTGALEVVDMPTLSVKGKALLDERALARLVDDWSSRVREVWLEQVTPRPGQSVSGVRTSCTNYGLLRGICIASFLPIQDVAPAKWKAALKVPADKDGARLRASNLLPRDAHRWPLKKHDGRAESALIALYGAQQLQLSDHMAA